MSHVPPENVAEINIASSIHKEIEHTNITKLSILESDGTLVMIGSYNGPIRKLQELDKPLQWAICLLHCTELLLRHALVDNDSTSTSVDKFFGFSGKKPCWQCNKLEVLSLYEAPLLPIYPIKL